MCENSSGEYAHEKITSATAWYDVSATTTNNLQKEIPGKQTTRERWRAFRGRMCILEHLRQATYGWQRKREYNFIWKLKLTDTLLEKKYILDSVHDANDQPNSNGANKLLIFFSGVIPVVDRSNYSSFILYWVWCWWSVSLFWACLVCRYR